MKAVADHNQRDISILQRDVWMAKRRISPFVQETPLIYSETLSEQYQTAIYLKLEQLNRSGSFKIRGAANKILSLTDLEKEKGIATFSTGNFARSVAYVSNQLGIKAVICISNRVPSVKTAALEQMGVEVVKVGMSQDDAEAHCYRLEKEYGLTVIHPFDDPHVIAGQGTIGLEVLEQLPDVDTVIAGLSGGGLHSGLGVALKSAMEHTLKLIGVSTEQGAAMYESISAKKPVKVNENDTLADSLLGGIGMDNRYTFKMVQRYVDQLVLVNEQDIADGMRHMFQHERMIVEGAAAAGIGALKHQKITLGGQVVFVITGDSVNTEIIESLLQ